MEVAVDCDGVRAVRVDLVRVREFFSCQERADTAEGDGCVRNAD